MDERVTIGVSNSEVVAEHISRYEFAKLFTQTNDKVLDVACGTGYGTAMLAENAKEVHGVDISSGAIAYATTNYSSDNVTFLECDCTQLPYDDDTFDVVVSFETIEHIPNVRKFVKECHRVLKPDGCFICSTPNANHSSPDGNIINPYHVFEFAPDSFKMLLSDTFHSDCVIYGQHDVKTMYTFIVNNWCKLKSIFGITRPLIYRNPSAQHVPSTKFPIGEFKNNMFEKSAYIVAICYK